MSATPEMKVQNLKPGKSHKSHLFCGLRKAHKNGKSSKHAGGDCPIGKPSNGENDSGCPSEVSAVFSERPVSVCFAGAEAHASSVSLPAKLPSTVPAVRNVPLQSQGHEAMNIAQFSTVQREDNSQSHGERTDEATSQIKPNNLVTAEDISLDGNNSLSNPVESQEPDDGPITAQTSPNTQCPMDNGSLTKPLPLREDNSEVVAGLSVDHNRDQSSAAKTYNKPIPCYGTVAASGDDDKESGYGSIEIKIGEQVFPLQTELAPDEEFPPIPEEVISFVESLCEEYDVDIARVTQSLDNCKEFSLQGVDVERVKDTFETVVKQKFPSFTMTVEEIDDMRESTSEFIGPHSSHNSFRLIKTVRQPEKVKPTIVKRSVCEMVLEGLNVSRNHVKFMSKFVLVPAHSVLEDTDCKDLLSEDVPPNVDELKRQEVLGRAQNTQYYVQQHTPNRLLSLEFSSLNFVYRHYKSSDGTSTQPYSRFLADAALLEVNGYELDHSGENVISFQDLEEKMRLNADRKRIAGLMPLRKEQDLKTMGLARVRVKVGDRFGYMIHLGPQVGRKKQRQQLLNIHFVTDGPLFKGQSGSVVYVIHAKTGEYYQLGMLIGELYESSEIERTQVYQAVVVRQALDELEVVHRKYVKELRPLCQEYLCDGHMPELLKELARTPKRSNIEHRSGLTSASYLDSGLELSNSRRTGNGNGLSLNELNL